MDQLGILGVEGERVVGGLARLDGTGQKVEGEDFHFYVFLSLGIEMFLVMHFYVLFFLDYGVGTL